MKRAGPRTDPCGTLKEMGAGSEVWHGSYRCWQWHRQEYTNRKENIKVNQSLTLSAQRLYHYQSMQTSQPEGCWLFRYIGSLHWQIHNLKSSSMCKLKILHYSKITDDVWVKFSLKSSTSGSKSLSSSVKISSMRCAFVWRCPWKLLRKN